MNLEGLGPEITPRVERAFAAVRKIAPSLTQDRSLSGDIAHVAEAIRRGDFDDESEKS